jgi:hypothetical protein
MKNLNSSRVLIIVLLAVLALQYFKGNSYKKEYEKMMKEKEAEYQLHIEKLEHEADSILTLNQTLIDEIGTIDDKIAQKDALLARLKRKYHEQVDKLDDMSDDELAVAFANAFK